MDQHEEVRPADDVVHELEAAGEQRAEASSVSSNLPSPPTAEAQHAPAWSRGDIVGVVIAAVGGAAIVLTLLVPRASHRGPTLDAALVPMASPSTPSASPTAHSSSAGIAPRSMSHGWQRATEWVGRTKRSVAYELEADRPVHAWMRQVRPVLVVRCLSGTVDAFVVTGTSTAIEPGRSDHTVRVAFDGEPPIVEHWADSAEHDGLFAPDGAAFLGRLTRSRLLRVAFTPHNAPEAEASFDLSGVDGIVGPVGKHCH